MDTRKLQSLRDIGGTKALLWIWYVVSALGAGVWVGNLVPQGFHLGFFLAAFAGGLIANIPVWVIFDMLRRVVLTQQELHFINNKPQASPKG